MDISKFILHILSFVQFISARIYVEIKRLNIIKFFFF